MPSPPRTLDVRIADALAQAAATLGGGPLPDGHDEVRSIAAAAAALSARLRAPGDVDRAELARLGGLLVELHDLRDELRERRLARHLAATTAVGEALLRLRASGSVIDMLARVCPELCRACDFDRAVLFRLAGDKVVMEHAHVTDDDAAAAAILAAGRAHRVQLASSLLETELAHRGEPALVEDPRGDPRTHKPMVEATGTRGYVAAPVIASDRVLGFLHADTHVSGRTLDLLDRDVLWTFAVSLGDEVERAILRERLDSQQRQMHRLASSTAEIMRELAVVDVDLAPSRAQREPAANGLFAHADDAPGVAGEERLTRREREVLALMAAGHTNVAIAERLVISPGTVKSHVKRILRKLRAANRAEAVARYLRREGSGLSAGPSGSPRPSG